MNLSVWQRIKRRFALMGGGYTHPDGTIELDFEYAAGITPGDSESIKDLKLKRYYAKQRAGRRAAGALIVGGVAFLFADRLGVSTLGAIAVWAVTAFGLNLLVND